MELTARPVSMEAGDALCFNEMMPHCAMPNRSDLMRWSMDTRFVTAAAAQAGTLKNGMLARCGADPSRETAYDEWLAKWPEGSGY